MGTSNSYDVAIIGGGIVGLATAMALTRDYQLHLVVLEAEDHVAAHQTGHNSGVIHAGLYYKPGSLKARNCVEGREALYVFCQEHAIPHDRCGKLVVATRESELPALDELERRGHANGIPGLKRLRGEELHDYEPHVVGIAGLHVPVTGIIDYADVARVYARLTQEVGGELRLKDRFQSCRVVGDGMVLETTQGQIATRHLIACAGLQADRVAWRCGIDPRVRVVPFRGEYYELTPEKIHLVRNLIYPVPDARFPFLGVHFTRMIKGGIEAGPNAVLAFKREGYRRRDWSVRDLWEIATYGGFWRMAWRYWRMGLSEFQRSLSKRAFVHALQQLVPELQMDDVRPAGAGVRAMALGRDGRLVDDFLIVEEGPMIRVLNAPSPAATASLSIGKTIATKAAQRFGLKRR